MTTKLYRLIDHERGLIGAFEDEDVARAVARTAGISRCFPAVRVTGQGHWGPDGFDCGNTLNCGNVNCGEYH